MRVVFTDEALRDLDGILAYISLHYPMMVPAFERRLRAVLARMEEYPVSAPTVAERPDVRMIPLIRYPYKIFYRMEGERIEILHVHHAARG